jgi:HlyD family secretion protein
VFVIQGDSVVFRPVQVGITGESYFEVTAGLRQGDTVVAGPYQAIRELQPGSRIERTETGDGAESGAEGGASE